MKLHNLFIPGILLLLLLFISCVQTPDYSSVENFLNDFISALKNGQQGRYLNFYLRAEDFNPDSPGADLAIERFTETVQNEFLSDCQRASRLLLKKQVTVEEIKLDQSEKLIAKYLRYVRDNYSNVLVSLRVDDYLIVLQIKEVIQVGEEWRLTTFSVTVDAGSENIGPIHLRQQE